MTRRQDIQILRGLAVLVVVLFHLSAPLFGNGFLGVDVFFVISGFLMAALYRPGEVVKFYTRRMRRLLPAYFATIAITLIICVIVTLPSEYPQVIDQALFSTFYASNFGFWLQNSYFSKSNFNPLLHLWSIGVEFQFYLIVPALAWIYARSKVTLLVVGVASFLAMLIVVMISPKTAFFLLPFRIWQFLLGAACAEFLARDGAVKYRRPAIGLFAVGVICLAIAAYPVHGEALTAMFGHPGAASAIVTVAAAAALGCGLPAYVERSVVGLGLAKLGDWSYSIYLAHFPVIVLVLYQPFSGTMLHPDGAADLAWIFALGGLFAAVLYLGFEKGYLFHFNPKLVPIPMATIVLGCMLLPSINQRFYDAQELRVLASVMDKGTYRCGKIFRFLNPGSRWCELSDGLPPGAPVLLLVGDSHADALKEALLRQAKAKGYRLLLSVSNDPLGGKGDADKIVRYAKEIGARQVILHFSPKNVASAWNTGFVSSAVSAGIQTAWILPVPVYGESVPKALWSARAEARQPRITEELFDSDDLAERVRGAGGAPFNPRVGLCKERCVLENERGQPLYYDDSHLSLTGAEYLSGFLSHVIGSFKAHTSGAS